jgi:transcriptional regulator with XRE-family HTH domain
MRTHGDRYKAFLTRLRQARIDSGLTQDQVAQLLNRGQSYVSKCEVGDRRVDVIELQEFARLYHRPIGYFLEGQPEDDHP